MDGLQERTAQSHQGRYGRRRIGLCAKLKIASLHAASGRGKTPLAQKKYEWAGPRVLASPNTGCHLGPKVNVQHTACAQRINEGGDIRCSYCASIRVYLLVIGSRDIRRNPKEYDIETATRQFVEVFLLFCFLFTLHLCVSILLSGFACFPARHTLYTKRHYIKYSPRTETHPRYTPKALFHLAYDTHAVIQSRAERLL